jgi:hypothetical protein
MRKIMLLAISVAALIPLPQLSASTLAGVTLSDTAQVGSTTLVLNGMGLRTKFMVKVYVAGLYLPQKSKNAEAIIKADTPKRIVLHFVRNVNQSQIADAFSEDFHKNSPQAANAMKADVDRFLAAIEPLREGGEMVFTYTPQTGTSVEINGSEKVIIPGAAFQQMLLSVWLGPYPPNASLKKGLLAE